MEDYNEDYLLVERNFDRWKRTAHDGASDIFVHSIKHKDLIFNGNGGFMHYREIGVSQKDHLNDFIVDDQGRFNFRSEAAYYGGLILSVYAIDYLISIKDDLDNQKISLRTYTFLRDLICSTDIDDNIIGAFLLKPLYSKDDCTQDQNKKLE